MCKQVFLIHNGIARHLQRTESFVGLECWMFVTSVSYYKVGWVQQTYPAGWLGFLQPTLSDPNPTVKQE
jgi:hypothetical protein